jgi:hypothetical protein
LKLTESLVADQRASWAAGWYLAEPEGFLSRAFALVWMAPPHRVPGSTMEPSSRSIAFTRAAWERVGGYPEDHIWGEDTLLASRLHQICGPMVFVPGALVRYTVRGSWRNFAQLAHHYATGDGFYGLRRKSIARNAAKVCVIAGLVAGGVRVDPWLFAAIGLWVWWLVFRDRMREGLKLKHVLQLPLYACIKTTGDIAFLVGYASGHFQRRRYQRANGIMPGAFPKNSGPGGS